MGRAESSRENRPRRGAPFDVGSRPLSSLAAEGSGWLEPSDPEPELAGDATGVPLAGFDSRDVERGEGFDAFRESIRAFYDANSLTEARDHEVRVLIADLADVLFCHYAGDPSAFVRNRLAIETGTDELVVLNLMVSGEETVAAGDRVDRMTPGTLALRDWARPFASTSGRMEIFGLAIPRRLLLAERGQDLDVYRAWSRDSPAGRVLDSTLGGIWRSEERRVGKEC